MHGSTFTPQVFTAEEVNHSIQQLTLTGAAQNQFYDCNRSRISKMVYMEAYNLRKEVRELIKFHKHLLYQAWNMERRANSVLFYTGLDYKDELHIAINNVPPFPLQNAPEHHSHILPSTPPFFGPSGLESTRWTYAQAAATASPHKKGLASKKTGGKTKTTAKRKSSPPEYFPPRDSEQPTRSKLRHNRSRALTPAKKTPIGGSNKKSGKGTGSKHDPVHVSLFPSPPPVLVYLPTVNVASRSLHLSPSNLPSTSHLE